MRLFKLLSAVISIYFIFIFFGTSITSCKKTNTVHDTTIVTIKDTVTLKDTVTITDTLGNLSDGLVAYYNFNGGNLNDSSGNNNNIVFSNATMTTDRFGNPNNAYLFDGSSSYMRVPNSASINPNKITLYAIIRPQGFNQLQCHGNQILGKSFPDDVNGYYVLRFGPLDNGSGTACTPAADTTKEYFFGQFGDNIPQGSAGSAGSAGYAGGDSLFVRKDEWYTIAYTFDGTTSKLYVNGALLSTYVNPTTVTFTPSTQDLIIGATESSIFPYFFKGIIDEIRIYNKPITDQQIGYLSILKNKYLRSGNKIIY